MTELETMQRAKMYMEKLAQGVDPITNQEIPEDSVLNNVRLARCFFYVSDVLGRVIANGGFVGPKPQLRPFAIDTAHLAGIILSQEPVRVTQLVDMIHRAAGDSQMKKPNPTAITNWLVEKGFLEKQTMPDGKYRRVPTQRGMEIGLLTAVRQGANGEYIAVLYNIQAQRFVLDNLSAMLTEKNDGSN